MKKDDALTFSAADARAVNERCATPVGQYLASRQEKLIFQLLKPLSGERLLHVGIIPGDSLAPFLAAGCMTAALVPSSTLADLAGKKLGQRVEFHVGPAHDLPFANDEFDIVVLNAALEFTENPGQAINEAIRVSRDRVFLGVWNRCSLLCTKGRRDAFFPPEIHDRARPFYATELLALIHDRLGPVQVKWGSHIFFPYRYHKYTAGLEEFVPLMKNPFGAFLGMSFPVVYTYRTIQDVIRDPFKIKKKEGEPARSLVKEGTT